MASFRTLCLDVPLDVLTHVLCPEYGAVVTAGIPAGSVIVSANGTTVGTDGRVSVRFVVRVPSSYDAVPLAVKFGKKVGKVGEHKAAMDKCERCGLRVPVRIESPDGKLMVCFGCEPSLPRCKSTS